MAILKETVVRDITATFHKFDSFIVNNENTTAVVLSWSDEAAFLANKSPVGATRILLTSSEEILNDLAALAMTDVFLAGGTTMPDNSGTLPNAKLRKIAQLKSTRDTTINGGFAWDSSGFDSDPISQSRILGAFVANSPVTWRLSNNTWRELSVVELGGLWQALQGHLQAAFTAFAIAEAAVNACTTIEELNAL
jgi:hypothetical protein